MVTRSCIFTRSTISGIYAKLVSDCKINVFKLIRKNYVWNLLKKIQKM